MGNKLLPARAPRSGADVSSVKPTEKLLECFSFGYMTAMCMRCGRTESVTLSGDTVVTDVRCPTCYPSSNLLPAP